MHIDNLNDALIRIFFLAGGKGVSYIGHCALHDTGFENRPVTRAAFFLSNTDFPFLGKEHWPGWWGGNKTVSFL